MISPKLKNKVYKYIDNKRIPHVDACIEQSIHLAQKYGEDGDKAATAAALHDITKKLDYKSQLKLIKKYDVICDKELLDTPKILHSVTGAYFARDKFNISDEIFGAIRYHTTGKPEMSILEKIIYLADITEKTRDFPGVDELRELCEEDLDKAMELGLRMSIYKIQEYGNKPYKDSIEAYEYYKNIIS